MSRLSRTFLMPLVAALLAAGPPTDHKPTPADLARDLGSPSYAVREKASKDLWQFGPAARPTLETAAKSSDTEVRTRAAAILEKFDWGIFPDTPPAVVRQIREFRTQDRDRQFQAITELLRLDAAGFTALRAVLARECPPDRRAELFAHVGERLRVEVPKVVVAGHLDRAESLLEINALGIADYAVFMMLRDRLPEAAVRLEAAKRDWSGAHADAAAKGLVFVHRLAGDGQKAREAAKSVRNAAEADLLVEALLEEQGAWAELTGRAIDDTVQSRVGLAMFRHRMAGHTPKVNELAAAAREATQDGGLHAGDVHEAALGLLLNGRSQEGIELLRSRRSQPHMLADVLAARLEFREALDLIGQGATARAADADADPRLRTFYSTRKARLLAQLGRTEDAVQLFNQTAAAIRDRDQYTIQQLLRAEVRAGRLDLAAEHAAKFQHQYDQAGQGYYLRPGPFEVLFEEDAEAARGLWHALRRHVPKEDPGQTMKRVRELLAGSASESRLVEAVKAVSTARDGADSDGARSGDRIVMSFVTRIQYAQALAATYRAAGRLVEAEKELARAAEATSAEASAEDSTAGGGPRAWVYGTDERYRPWLELGDFLYDAGRFVHAANRYEEGWKRFPENPILLYLSGRALTKSGNEVEGRRRMDLAHWVPLGNARLRGRFLEELCNRGYLPAARRERDLARQTVWYGEPYRGNVWNQIGRASVLLKDFDAAAAASERSLHYILRTTGVTFVEGAAYVTAPTGVKAFQARSRLAAGKADEAVALARECLDVLPGHVETAISMVPELDAVGRTADGDSLFQAVWGVYRSLTKDHPKSAWAHNGAAAVAAGCRRELAEALADARRAVELEPGLKAYQETLAEVHFRRGEREPALAVMRKLAKAEPRNHLYKRQLVRYAKGDVASPLPTEASD